MCRNKIEIHKLGLLLLSQNYIFNLKTELPNGTKTVRICIFLTFRLSIDLIYKRGVDNWEEIREP